MANDINRHDVRRPDIFHCALINRRIIHTRIAIVINVTQGIMLFNSHGAAIIGFFLRRGVVLCRFSQGACINCTVRQRRLHRGVVDIGTRCGGDIDQDGVINLTVCNRSAVHITTVQRHIFKRCILKRHRFQGCTRNRSCKDDIALLTRADNLCGRIEGLRVGARRKGNRISGLSSFWYGIT